HLAEPPQTGSGPWLSPVAQAGCADASASHGQPDDRRGGGRDGTRTPALRVHRTSLAVTGDSAPAAMTASVRLVTLSALRIAVTWFFTVGWARSSTRQIALLLLPCIMRTSTSRCRGVRPSTAAGGRRPSVAAGAGGVPGAGTRTSGGT